MFNKKGITLRKFVENKQKFIPILKEYSKKTEYKNGTKTFVIEVIKKYLLSCKTVFQSEYNNDSETCSFKFSITKASFILKLKKTLQA